MCFEGGGAPAAASRRGRVVRLRRRWRESTADAQGSVTTMIWSCQATAGFRAVVDARVSTVTAALGCMCCDSDSSTRNNPSLDKKMNIVLRRWPEANWDMIAEVVALVISDSIDEADGGGSKMADAMRLMRLMHHRVMSASEVLAPAAPPLSIDRRGRVSKQLLQNECVFKRFVAYTRALGG